MTSEPGYPSEEDLARIHNWKIYGPRDIRALLAFVQQRWEYSSYFDPIPLGEQEFQVHTGGWSGNEDLIAALEDNEIFWMVCWQATKRGGHYTFSIPSLPEIPDDVDTRPE